MRDPVLSCSTSTASIQCNDSFPEELNLYKQTYATCYASDRYPRLARLKNARPKDKPYMVEQGLYTDSTRAVWVLDVLPPKAR